MSFSKVYSVQNNLLKAQIIDVECDVSTKVMNRFDIVGLGDKAVDEAKERISAAIKNCGLDSPKSDQIKTTISLAPANIKKTGPIFDLAMALCFLKATQQIAFSNKGKIFIGELSLDGKIRGIKGVLPMVVEAKRRGFEEIFVPPENAFEAALIKGITVYPAEDLMAVINHLDSKSENISKIKPQEESKIEDVNFEDGILLDHIKGNESAKRAMTVALAGGHNLCFYGPPGTGKTMLAKAASNLMPSLSFENIVEVTSLYSITGELDDKPISRSPFRSPHHTSSYVSIVGGGTEIKPGEISLAHRGILFLDEFPEFDRRVINSLRQPLEESEVKISRAKETAVLPADFILMISMNPCPCGFYGYDSKNCSCSMNQISKYQKKISGPIMDRIDIWVEVSAIEYKKLIERSDPTSLKLRGAGKREEKSEKDETSLTFRARKQIKDARDIQYLDNKQKINREILNGNLSTNQLEKILEFEDGVKDFLDESAERLRLSARSYTRILKVALTISQMNGDSKIKKEHLLEAFSWRPNSKFFI